MNAKHAQKVSSEESHCAFPNARRGSLLSMVLVTRAIKSVLLVMVLMITNATRVLRIRRLVSVTITIAFSV